MDIDIYQHFDAMVSEGVAEISDRHFHGHRVYLIDTDYVLDNFDSMYVDHYDGKARDGILHTEADVDAVVEIIGREGFLAPISSGAFPYISDGHARLAAASRLGIARVPVAVTIGYGVSDGSLPLADEPFPVLQAHAN